MCFLQKKLKKSVKFGLGGRSNISLPRIGGSHPVPSLSLLLTERRGYSNVLGDLQPHIGLDHHLNDNHQPQIALLASSVSIELVSSSARVTSAKSQPKLPDIERPGPIDRTPETPGSGKNGVRKNDWTLRQI